MQQREIDLEDERLARELQRQLDEEMNQQNTASVRRDRRRKYKEFLKPYTMVVQSEDLIHKSCEDTNGKSGHNKPDPAVFDTNDVETGEGESEGNNESDQSPREDVNVAKKIPHHEYECGKVVDFSSDQSCKPVGNCTGESFLALPVQSNSGTPLQVEASCAVCIMDYEVGDKVVFSTRRVCPHAFHEDCIMMWLEKGKKRCPVCRNFFVPGSKVDGKQEITHDADDEYAIQECHLQSREASPADEESPPERIDDDDDDDDDDSSARKE